MRRLSGCAEWFVKRNKPLFRRSEDDRCLAPPVVRIAMHDVLLRKQPLTASQFVLDQFIGFFSRLTADELRGRVIKATIRKNEAVDLQAVPQPSLVIIL